MDLLIVILTVIAAAIYGIIFFFKAWMTTIPKPPFDYYKFGATLIVAIIVGLIAAFSGATLDEAMFLAQMAEYGFYVAMVETILKGLFQGKWPAKYSNS